MSTPLVDGGRWKVEGGSNGEGQIREQINSAIVIKDFWHLYSPRYSRHIEKGFRLPRSLFDFEKNARTSTGVSGTGRNYLEIRSQSM